VGLSTAATYHLKLVKGATFSRTFLFTDKASAIFHPIIAVNTTGVTWTVRGDQRALFGAGKTLVVENNNPAANGRYTVVGSGLNGAGDTVITVGSIDSDAVANGTIRRETNSPIDLTGYSVVAQIRDIVGGSDLIDFAASVDSPATDGKITLALTAVQTSAITWPSGVYDVQFTDGSNHVSYWLQGEVNVESPVTQ
jgi:hypothetical protein